tara:strand:- start:1398 stop:1610 length:213 start_codon:yes stop_codon:yes gene_type:complete
LFLGCIIPINRLLEIASSVIFKYLGSNILREIVPLGSNKQFDKGNIGISFGILSIFVILCIFMKKLLMKV